jgi:hypothetical protein
LLIEGNACANSNDLELVKLSAYLVFRVIRMSQKEKNHTINSRSWNVLVSHELEDFCIRANAWNATTVALPEVMDAKGG